MTGHSIHSVEIELLDQLLTDPMALNVLRAVCPIGRAIYSGHLWATAGDICLFSDAGTAVPDWRWPELFKEGQVPTELDRYRAHITDQAANRIA